MTNPLHDFVNATIHIDRGIWKWAHYLDIYHQKLGRFRTRAVTLLEIGVMGGGSLDMWRAYFNDQRFRRQTTIHGVDHNPACAEFDTADLRRDGIHVHIGDQCDLEFWSAFKRNVPSLDIVIDDGSHDGNHQSVSFNALFPHLSPGGVYIVEDMEPNTFMQQMLSVMWNLQPRDFVRGDDVITMPITPLHRQVASVSVYPGMVVIEKAAESIEFVARRRGRK